jgi:negative regulator of flagellin synthesis FlgM
MEITGKKTLAEYHSYIRQIQQKNRLDSNQSADRKSTVQQDVVALSPEAKKLQEVQQLVKSIPEVREAKIAEVRDQIQNGTYRVEGKKIAFNLIKESLINEIL